MALPLTRRSVLAGAGTTLASSVSGCLLANFTDDQEKRCFRDQWAVRLYNDYTETRRVTVWIRDSEGSLLHSETAELDPETDYGSAIELGHTVRFDRRYTFEAAISNRPPVTEEIVLKCGDVFVSVSSDDELVIRDDRVDHI